MPHFMNQHGEDGMTGARKAVHGPTDEQRAIELATQLEQAIQALKDLGEQYAAKHEENAALQADLANAREALAAMDEKVAGLEAQIAALTAEAEKQLKDKPATDAAPAAPAAAPEPPPTAAAADTTTQDAAAQDSAEG